MLTVRASMLPSYADCARRSAAKSFSRIVEGHGFELRRILPSVGAAVGTSVHGAVAHALRSKMETGKLPTLSQAIELGVTRFREEVDTGAEWDATTPHANTAELQIDRMTRAYFSSDLINCTPVLVEGRMKAKVNADVVLSGQPDLVTVDGWLHDLKTGVLRRTYHRQFGAYSLLAKAHKVTVTRGCVDFIKRLGATKTQDDLVTEEYPLAICEEAAKRTLARVQQDMDAFLETGDPGAFQYNGMSMMCTPKYCPAHGTDFCEITKGR